MTTPEYHNLLTVVCTLIEVGGVQWMESDKCDRSFYSGWRVTHVILTSGNGTNHQMENLRFLWCVRGSRDKRAQSEVPKQSVVMKNLPRTCPIQVVLNVPIRGHTVCIPGHTMQDTRCKKQGENR